MKRVYLGVAVGIFFLSLLGCFIAPISAARGAPAPKASLDNKSLLSFEASPSLSGSAANLIVPLHLSITASSTISSSTMVMFSKDFATTTKSWSVMVYPPLPEGLYQVTLTSGGSVLDRGQLFIGAKFPTVTLDQTLAPYDVADGHLARFSIHAEHSIGIAQFAFSIQSTAATVDSVTLYGFTDSAYSQAIATNTDATLASAIPDATSSIARLIPNLPIEIPAGTTYYFELDGSVTPTDAAYSVTTALLKDSEVTTGNSVAELASSSNFIWSPNSFGMASSSDLDWVNGGAIPELFRGIIAERYSTPILACDLQASTSTIQASTPVVLTWTSSGADRAVWNDGSSANLQGSRTLVASSTRTYFLSFSGSLGTTQCFATVTLQTPTTPVLPTGTYVATTTTPATTSTATISATSTLASFSATPESGKAPLSVIFKGSVNTSNSCAASTYTFAYGDNSTTTISVPARLCKPQSFSFAHTYSAVNTYSAKLYFGSFAKGGTTTPTLIQSQKITSAKLASGPASLSTANVFSSMADIGGTFWLWIESLIHSVGDKVGSFFLVGRLIF